MRIPEDVGQYGSLLLKYYRSKLSPDERECQQWQQRVCGCVQCLYSAWAQTRVPGDPPFCPAVWSVHEQRAIALLERGTIPYMLTH